MRLAAWLSLALLLAVSAFGPTATAAADGIRIDAEIVLDADGSTLRQVLTLTESSQHFSPWRLIIPDGFRFVEAHDARGTLPATVEGERVSIDARGTGSSYWLQVTYEGAAEASGPFLVLPAQVSAPAEAPTTARAILPEGWRLVGWRSSTLEPDANGIFRTTGAMYAEYLALPSDAPLEPADPRAVGAAAPRDVEAQLSADGVEVRWRLFYDTDVYGEEWTFSLPDNATFVGARSTFGTMPAQAQGEEVTVVSPYPMGHHLGGRWIELTWRLPAPEAYGGGFRTTFVSEPGLAYTRAEGAPTLVFAQATLDLALADGFVMTGWRGKDVVAVAPHQLVGEGALGVTLGLLPPARADEVEIVTAAFHARAPADLADEARMTLEESQRHLASALGFLGGNSVERPVYVQYTRDEIFGWEAGFYRPGMNTISIRAANLANTTDRPDLQALSTLLHETAHALIDRLLPGAPDGFAFFDEGLARLAEVHLELALPDEVVRCESTLSGRSCSVVSSRPDVEEVEHFHASGQTFPLSWSTGSVDDKTRGFLYDYSGLIFHAYEARAPPTALVDALAELAATGFPEDDAAARELVVATLLAHAPGLTRDELFHVGRGMEDEKQFRACLAELLAPPLPWEDIPGAGDCHAYRHDAAAVTAAREVAGPTPPPAYAPLPTPTSTQPAPTPWSPEAPPRVVPEDGGATDDGSGGSATGGVLAADGEPAAPIPGLGLAALVLALGLVAAASARSRR